MTGDSINCCREFQQELFQPGVLFGMYDKEPEKEWDAEDPLEEAVS